MASVRLYVGGNSSVTAVARRRLRVARGRRVRRSWDGVVELAAMTPSAHEPTSVTQAAWVVVPPAVVAAVMMPLGADPLVAAAGGGVTFFAASYLLPAVRRRLPRRGAAARSAPPGATVPGAPPQCHLLFDDEERGRFRQALAQADRIAETLPALRGLVDEADAHRMLVEALWDLAGVLSRRQEVRRVLADLDRQDDAEVSPASAAVRDLLAQRTKARALFVELDEDVERRLGNLSRVERAGRGFLREREIRRTVREAARLLDDAPKHGGPGAPDAGEELAEQTATVLDAYRELSADHGDEVAG